MADKKTNPAKKNTKKDIHKELHAKLTTALADYKAPLGKKFESKVKKAVKLISSGLAKAGKKKPATVIPKKKPVKKKVKSK